MRVVRHCPFGGILVCTFKSLDNVTANMRSWLHVQDIDELASRSGYILLLSELECRSLLTTPNVNQVATVLVGL